MGVISGTIQGVLCQSRLFYTQEKSDALPLSSSPMVSVPWLPLLKKRWHLAMVCLGLGLMTTVQVDGWFGQAVHSRTDQDIQNYENSLGDEAIAIEPVTMPQFSLQKSDDWQTQGDNSFTQKSDQTIISDLNPYPEQDQDLTRKKQKILAEVAGTYPSFNNPLLNEKIALYHNYLREHGAPPDVMIIGSSRALRGVDPEALRQGLINNGHGNLEVFNFGINGATAQVVQFVLEKVLLPQQLPQW
ncbi:MAG: hypothetical protein HC796_02210 [Synechococcaceae cyanobacterium RL_1_2]|nr:hypothetical protein [Synechococcaceae cyanobacterium RL_1_2]